MVWKIPSPTVYFITDFRQLTALFREFTVQFMATKRTWWLHRLASQLRLGN
jgi:hypothetical protein